MYSKGRQEQGKSEAAEDGCRDQQWPSSVNFNKFTELRIYQTEEIVKIKLNAFDKFYELT